MAIADEDQFETFEGNASTVTAYAIPFAFRASEDLIVTRIDADGERTLLVEGDDYTVTDSNLVTTEAIPVDEFLEVERDTPLTQDLDTESPAGSYITAIEGRLDRIVMALQDLLGKHQRLEARCYRVPVGETVDAGALGFEIGTVTHLAEGQTPTASITGPGPTFTLNFGLPTGATGGLDIGADASFGTTPNNQGGPALTLYDFGTGLQTAIWLNNGVFTAGTFNP